MTTGFALGVGGPKRLGITLLAAATITGSKDGTSHIAELALFYVAVATVFVTVPTAIYLVLGTRADDLFTRAGEWLQQNRQTAEAYSCYVLGAILIVSALGHLV